MIIGRGLIANAFRSYENKDDIIIFASGISNSTEVSKSDQEREKKLLEETTSNNPDKKLIYFSTCSIYDKTKINDPYIKHKIEIEEFIKLNCKSYIIFRITNPVGKTKNKNTFLNYLIDKIQNEQTFEIWKNSKRNIIDVEDMENICSYIIAKKEFENRTINIASSRFYEIEEIVNTINIHLNKKGHYVSKDKGGTPEFNNEICLNVSEKLGINFNIDYLQNVLNKYYPKNEL